MNSTETALEGEVLRKEFVKLTRTAAGVARLTLARPARRNSINSQMADELAEAVSVIVGWGTLVGVLDAEGPAFCAGADLGELHSSGAAVDSVVESLSAASVHWTAAVNGAVRGGGMSILAPCARVVATPAASFGLPELARGFFPTEVIGAQVAVLGARHAFDLAFRAEPIDANEAKRIGLVAEVVAEAELEATLEAESARLLSYDRSAVRVGVELWQSRNRVDLGR